MLAGLAVERPEDQETGDAAGKRGRSSNDVPEIEYRQTEPRMAEVRRFAGFLSPGILIGDPHLSREDKIDALEGWRSLVVRDDVLQEEDDSAARRRLIGEISRALALLTRH
jgi:hypothetical protein